MAGPERGAIVTPVVDWLTCGGLSLVLILPVLGYRALGGSVDVGMTSSEYLLYSALINGPHFMASYRLLYQSRDNLQRFPWAALYVPILLVVLGLLALDPTIGLALPGGRALPLNVCLTLTASLYLAWHYTGQAWGMTASYAFICGVSPQGRERLLIRSGYHALLVWHFVFVAGEHLQRLFGDEVRAACELARGVADVIALVSFPVSAAGFWLLGRRCGRLPLRVVTPWVALYAWYALVGLDPSPAAAFVWLQAFHALQYLSFPIRVEVNRAARRSGRMSWGRAAIYYALLVLGGLLVFQLPDTLLKDPTQRVALIIANVVNIHHYFADGVVWKLRAPETRRDLFAHLA